jgi:CheY-like chemotaxis protein
MVRTSNQDTSQAEKVILLAEDDADDRMLFAEALQEVNTLSRLTMAKDGVQLMKILEETVPPPPHVIFLDLNMPRKNGIECLAEIRNDRKLKNIPVVVFSTSSQPEIIDEVYHRGANYYISKPSTFPMLKQAIAYVLAIHWHTALSQPSKEEFYLFKPNPDAGY